MRFKNIMSFLLCYMLFLSLLLSGCSNEKEQLTELPHIDREEQLVETDSYFTLNKDRTERTVKGWKYEPLVTVTTFRILNSNIKFPKGQDWEKNIWFDAYREYLGIDLKYTFICPSEDVWNIRCSQGFLVDNLPDVMPVYSTLFYKLSDANRLCDLKPYYQRYASEDVKYWMEKVNGGIAYDSCYREEKLNALATPAKQEANNIMWIRNDWLGNVGLEWPNNLSETLNVMRAFRNDDPDKDGKKDTYGMALDKSLDGLSAISVSLGALEGWVDINGGEDIEYGYVQPEWKEVCRVASELYKEGVIDPDFVKKTRAKIGNGYASQVLGLTADKTAINQIYKSVAANGKCNWDCGYIKDENGNIGVATATTEIQQFTCVSKKSTYPEAAILLNNIWEPLAMGDEQAYNNFVGKDGVRYNSSEYTAFGFGWPENDDNQSYGNVSSDLVAKKESNVSKRDDVVNTMKGRLKELTMYAESQGLYYADRRWGEECDAWIKYGPNLQYKHIEYFTRIISGEQGVDEGFDKWISYFRKAGGQECIDGYNEWWDAEGKEGFGKFITN